MRRFILDDSPQKSWKNNAFCLVSIQSRIEIGEGDVVQPGGTSIAEVQSEVEDGADAEADE